MEVIPCNLGEFPSLSKWSEASKEAMSVRNIGSKEKVLLEQALL